MKSKNLQLFVLLLVCFSTANWIIAQSFSENIVSHWSFDHDEGLIAEDEISGTEGLILGDLTEWIEGVNGNALDFTNAVDTTVFLVDDENYLEEVDFPVSSFSVALWAKILLGGSEKVLLNKGSIGTGDAHGPNANGDRYMITTKLFDNGSELRFTIDDGVTKTQLGFIPDTIYPEEWSHVVGVRNVEEKMMYLYLDGVEVASMEDLADSINTLNQHFLIGNYHQRASKFEGPVDDVLIIDKALSTEEVEELYFNDFETYVANTQKADDHLVIAPNPVHDELVIMNTSNFTRIEIYNITGQFIKTIVNNYSGTIRSGVNDFPTGKYIVKGYDENNVVTTGSFIKK